jgi:hypothetical protein
MRSVTFGALAAVAIAAFGCSGSGGGGGGSGGSGGSGSGSTTVSCTTSTLCTQIVVPSSGVSTENSTCTGVEMGKPGTGCSTTGLVGCCKLASSGESQEEQCYYSAEEESEDKSLCATMKGTWSATL